MAKFEQLRDKYKSVQQTMSDHQVRLEMLRMEGDKLYLKAIASSQDDKNKVWDEIKEIDPEYKDLICDIVVEPQPPPPVGGGGGTPITRTHVVQPGDTLSKISQTYYGDANQYMKIFDANKDQLSDPDKIRPGQKLLIP